MLNPIFIWYAAAGAVLIVVLFNLVGYVLSSRGKAHRRTHHILGLAKERDLFYIPGDNGIDDDGCDDDEL